MAGNYRRVAPRIETAPYRNSKKSRARCTERRIKGEMCGTEGTLITSQGELTTTPRPRAPFGSCRVPMEGQPSGRARPWRAAEFTRGATPAPRGQGLG